jgi:hypothetical protein
MNKNTSLQKVQSNKELREYHEKLKAELANRQGIKALAAIFNPITTIGPYDGVKGKLAEAISVASAMFQGVELSTQFGTEVLLPIMGRAWGCIHHDDPAGQCKISKEVCLLEHVAVCSVYKPNYEVPLYLDLKKNDTVTTCLICGGSFDEPRSTQKLSNLFCGECKDLILDLTQTKMQALVEYLIRRNK